MIDRREAAEVRAALFQTGRGAPGKAEHKLPPLWLCLNFSLSIKLPESILPESIFAQIHTAFWKETSRGAGWREDSQRQPVCEGV